LNQSTPQYYAKEIFDSEEFGEGMGKRRKVG